MPMEALFRLGLGAGSTARFPLPLFLETFEVQHMF